MSLGSIIKYTTVTGDTVNVMHTEDRADLPVFDYEIVDRDGEVVDHGEVLGDTALTFFAHQKRWTPIK